MFKRFQVLDMFYADKSFDVKEWVDVNDALPERKQGIYKVRRQNGNEVKAYYCEDTIDKLHRLSQVGQKYKTESSYWWDKETKKPLYDVTHWGKDENS